MRLARLGFVPLLGSLPVLGFGCSDPVPATPQAAFSVNFVDPGQACGIQGHQGGMGQVTDDTKDKLLVDGEEGAAVSCTVSGTGSFNVSGSATSPNGVYFLGISVNSIAPGTTRESPATGTVTFNSDKTGGSPVVSDSNDPCIFYFIPNTNQGVDAGKVWLTFECPRVTQGSEHTCAIQEGTVIFENCAQ